MSMDEDMHTVAVPRRGLPRRHGLHAAADLRPASHVRTSLAYAKKAVFKNADKDIVATLYRLSRGLGRGASS